MTQTIERTECSTPGCSGTIAKDRCGDPRTTSGGEPLCQTCFSEFIARRFPQLGATGNTQFHRRGAAHGSFYLR